MVDIIQTQVMGQFQFWIIFVFFIALSVIFLLVNRQHKKEIVLIHLLVMCMSLLIAGIAMLQYDLLLTLCFILFQVLSWFLSVLQVKI